MIIGLVGQKGSGKSVAASYLTDRGFIRQRFAQPIKDMLIALGLNYRHVDGDLKEEPCDILCGKTPRQVMQWIGTELGRDLISPDLWISLWKRRAQQHYDIVVDDVRFENEVDAVRSLGGVLWRINRPGYTGDGHRSEIYINTLDVDRELYNTGSLDYLKTLVEKELACLERTETTTNHHSNLK